MKYLTMDKIKMWELEVNGLKTDKLEIRISKELMKARL